MSNKQTILEIYDAFGRGDVPAILEKLSDQVEWDYSGDSDEVPWLIHRRGKEDVLNFFEAVGELEFNELKPKEFLEGEDLVVVLLDIDAVYQKTGKGFAETDAVHLWRFDRDGRVSGFRHGVDTYRHHLAYRGDAESATTAG